MIGAVLSWGLAWPLLKNRAGDWYPTGLASHSFRGLFACAEPVSKSVLLCAHCCDLQLVTPSLWTCPYCFSASIAGQPA